MARFTGKLQYEKVSETVFCISETVRFYIDDSCTGDYVELFAGAFTNFASVPKVLQFICRPDAEDVKMPAAFHDLMVSEFGQQIAIMNSGAAMRIPSWNESSFWFRKMIQVRQRQTRKKFAPLKRSFFTILDFSFRWCCWLSVSVHGLLKNE